MTAAESHRKPRKRKRAKGEGTVFRRADGLWIAQTARPERKAFTSRTSQAEAVRRRGEYLAKHGNISHVSAKQPLRDYLRDWLSTKEPNVRPRTFDGYRVTVNQHITTHIGDVRLCDLKPQHIQRCLDVAGSQWTRAKVYQTLNAALSLAVNFDVLTRNPCAKVKPPALITTPVEPVAEEAFYAFLGTIATDRLEALWLVLVAVGPRRGEAIGVPLSSGLNLRAGTMTFTGSLQRVRGKLTFVPAKTPKGNRTVKLPAPVVEALRRHLVRQKEEKLKAGEVWQEHDLLFTTRIGTPLEPRNVTRRFHQILAAAKIPHAKLHALRHTAISILLREGADIYAVQAMAGHARPSTTLEIYGHLMSAPSVTADKMTAVLRRRNRT